ncbi:hypothetical protein QCA50_001393 [Cerrena zonata]|uniref:ATP11-domain-containing protein n=1 Tax=Cerrena zonata TaxID=2478898 RepID=A0AAW0GKV4_9APHY
MSLFTHSLRRYPPRLSHSLLRQHAGRCNFSVAALRLKDKNTGSIQHVDYESKYAEKLKRRAAELGITVEQLREQIKEKDRKEKEIRRAVLEKHSPKGDPAYASEDVPAEAEDSKERRDPLASYVRKDSSPVKPLSSILNLDKLFQTEHTPEQVSVLWRAYHASRSKGTGRGYLCATVPVESYKHMLTAATRYPYFVLPIPRADAQVDEPVSEGNQPTEFFFMQWDFHGSPPDPKPKNDIFTRPIISKNPQTSTVLFTPLQEYKLRASYATPHLVITHYTDLVETHGLVLLRGEITPSTGNGGVSADGRFLLSQQDAQLLALGVQRFYLWSQGHDEKEALLKCFHENPDDFKWEDLLKHAEVSS